MTAAETRWPEAFDLARYCRELIADWPPLNSEQRAVVRTLREPRAALAERAPAGRAA